ncbi:transporter associated domain-containing protein [Petroclostridium sp. X23]|uniref:transporter associated domain-containing protein n=1 Tax=Petroclostridium sp. X23 TaxID=3045146 RepID=UPI0024ACABC1|nr:transporter associated domain-containing protein [Petroclostridium sp. X23]WHH60384.1 transporter associated domain-containing protein [Petroclostridium sp. X23]
MLKQYLRAKVSTFSSYIEIYISVLILLGIVVVSINLVKDLAYLIQNIYSNTVEFQYEDFLGYALQLIIGVEFVKMLAKHTPGSAIEVLLFAIARKLVVDHSTSVDLLLGIIAIGILFGIKKFLYTSSFTQEEGYVIGGATTIKQANLIASVNIPEGLGNTVAGVIANELREAGKKLSERATVAMDGVTLRIYSMRDGSIDKVQVIPAKKNKYII